MIVSHWSFVCLHCWYCGVVVAVVVASACLVVNHLTRFSDWLPWRSVHHENLFAESALASLTGIVLTDGVPHVPAAAAEAAAAAVICDKRG